MIVHTNKELINETMKTSIVESRIVLGTLKFIETYQKFSKSCGSRLTNIDFESLCHVIISGNGHNTNGDLILKAKVAGEAKMYRSRLASFPFTSELK